MKRHDKLPLKKAYYRIFTGMIVIPLVLVLVLSLVILGMQYREQAIENIRGVQKGVAAELQSRCGIHVHALVPTDQCK